VTDLTTQLRCTVELILAGHTPEHARGVLGSWREARPVLIRLRPEGLREAASKSAFSGSSPARSSVPSINRQKPPRAQIEKALRASRVRP